MSNLMQWLQSQRGINTLLLAAPDVNGVMRGKSLPARDAAKVSNGEVRMALSTPSVNILGNEIDGCSQVDGSGDCDIVLCPTGRTPYRSVLADDIAIVPSDFLMDDGTPVQTGCRQLIQSTIDAYRQRDWQPVVALEVEFYLYDLTEATTTPPRSPLSGERLTGRECGSIVDLQHFSPLLNDIRDHCHDAGIDTTSVLSENGPGMFEINLNHSKDLYKAVDDMAYMRLIMRDVALKHGLGLTYMPKPYADLDGSGQHMHFSVVDSSGRNIFDNGTAAGDTVLLHAVGGLLDRLNELVLFCAPHVSSYRRIQPNSYAPTGICWGYDNRTVPIRIPGGNHSARRIEYRVAGADANPYLLVSSVLMAALDGIDHTLSPPEPVTGTSYDQNFANVLSSMPSAINAFEESNFIKNLLPVLFREAYLNCKKQEYALITGEGRQFEIDTYRGRI